MTEIAAASSMVCGGSLLSWVIMTVAISLAYFGRRYLDYIRKVADA